MAQFDDQGRPVGDTPRPVSPARAPGTANSFDFNRPTVISLLYLSSCVLGVTALIGLVLAYVWRGETQAGAAWEASHFTYLIRTFWIGLAGAMVSVLLMIVLIGFVLIIGVAVWVIVRCVLSLVSAQKQEPMADALTWWV